MAKKCINNATRSEQLRDRGDHGRLRCRWAIEIGPGRRNPHARPVGQDHREFQLALVGNGVEDR